MINQAARTGKQFIEETYFIESYKELAINPEINWTTHVISWLNTNFNPKTFSFETCQLLDREIIIQGKDQELKFKLLTRSIFQESIKVNGVPKEALQSDEDLRMWFSQVFAKQISI